MQLSSNNVWEGYQGDAIQPIIRTLLIKGKTKHKIYIQIPQKCHNIYTTLMFGIQTEVWCIMALIGICNVAYQHMYEHCMHMNWQQKMSFEI